MGYTVGSLFSGIGGIDLAFEWARFTTAWQVEKEPFCQQVLAKHFPNADRHGDIYQCHDLPYVDVITAGFPCQPFSEAGLKRGVNDERFLVPEMFRIISEVQPHAILLENVPGFASINDGAIFRQLLGTLAQMGYDAEWGRIRASDMGAPHKRERWFCVAYSASNHNIPECRTVANPPRQTGKQNDGRFVGGGYPIMVNTHPAQGIGSNEKQCWPNGSNYLIDGGNPRTKSRVGRDAYGLSGRVDGLEHKFPAPPGYAQNDYEPPRVSTQSKTRAARLRALGNAVVPQCVYPLAVAIREWLDKT